MNWQWPGIDKCYWEGKLKGLLDATHTMYSWEGYKEREILITKDVNLIHTQIATSALPVVYWKPPKLPKKRSFSVRSW